MPSSSKTRRLSFIATGELVSKAFSLVRCEDTCSYPHYQPGSEYGTAHLQACVSKSAHLPRLEHNIEIHVSYMAIATARTASPLVPVSDRLSL